MRHSNHFNTRILWLRVFVKNVTGQTLRTLSHSWIQEITREAFRHTIQLTRCFWVYAATKRALIKVHEILKVFQFSRGWLGLWAWRSSLILMKMYSDLKVMSLWMTGCRLWISGRFVSGTSWTHIKASRQGQWEWFALIVTAVKGQTRFTSVSFLFHVPPYLACAWIALLSFFLLLDMELN